MVCIYLSKLSQTVQTLHICVFMHWQWQYSELALLSLVTQSFSRALFLGGHWRFFIFSCSRFPGQPLFLVSKSSSRLKMLTLVIHRKWNTMFLSLILLWCFIFWLYRDMYWNIIMYCFRKTKPKQNKKSKWEKFERLILRHTVLLSVRRG